MKRARRHTAPCGGVARLRCAKAVNALMLEGDEQSARKFVDRAIESTIRILCADAGGVGTSLRTHIR